MVTAVTNKTILDAIKALGVKIDALGKPVNPSPPVPTPVTPTTPVAPTAWQLGASASGGVITASFGAPKGFSGRFVADIEAFDAQGNKAGQWIQEQKSFTAGQVLTFSATPVLSAGTYSIKLGAFAPGWGQTYGWNDAAATLTVTSAPAPGQPAPGQPAPVPSSIQYTKPCWLGGWSGDPGAFAKNYIAANPGKTAVFITYNIPGRDNGNYSAGGLSGPAEYNAWVKKLADGIGTAPTIVVVEPDSLGLMSGLTEEKKADRYAMLQNAAKVLGALANTKVYQDASMWVGPADMAAMLKKITGVDGFSCNVSGNNATNEVSAWAEQVTAATGLKYVLDSSRNGNGHPHPGAWCNVTDTRIGVAPTNVTASKNCDAYLWLKVPGESDGLQINGNGTGPNRTDIPGAGGWWGEFATAIYSGDWKAFHAKYGTG